MNEIVTQNMIETRIHTVREKSVMLDFDLAALYDVETGQLKRAVRRNIDRFPEDFIFELMKEEYENLRCQIGISSWGGLRYPPFAFTEQGVAMLSSVLNSKRAVLLTAAPLQTFRHVPSAPSPATPDTSP